MDDTKIKVWGFLDLTKKQLLIFEMFFLTIFILLTIFLFSYEFPKHLNNEAFNFHGKYTKYISLLCTFLIILETQILWSRFTKEQLETIKEQKAEIEEQKIEIEKQNTDLNDSINYASKIQAALLPSPSKMERLLNNYLLYFKPKDVVSGDFYWVDEFNGKTIIVVADCTGHGVPGAFVSVLGISFLNDIVQYANINQQDLSPASVLNELRDKMMGALAISETEEKTYDGMDIAVCFLDRKEKKLTYSGAIHPLFLVRINKEKEDRIEQIRTDIHSISMLSSQGHNYTDIYMDVEQGDMLFMCSDGYSDQFGGEHGRKFYSKNLKEFFNKIADQPVEKQRQDLKDNFINWRGERDQLDDVLILGVRV